MVTVVRTYIPALRKEDAGKEEQEEHGRTDPSVQHERRRLVEERLVLL